MLRREDHCPNCWRLFNPTGMSKGEYCPECWRAWCRNDGSYEKRTKPISQVICEQLSK